MPGIPEESISTFRASFESDPRLRLARNVCSRHPLIDVMRPRQVEEQLTHVYSTKVDDGKPVTNQRSSGRCWIFACLNCMRLPYMKSLNVDDFEFSQNYLYFWDKLERFNYLMDAFLDTARRGEPADGRLVSHLLYNPSEDGGQWSMLVNLVEKYGVMPKKVFPDTKSAEESRRLCAITNSKMREFCVRLRALVEKGASDTDIESAKKEMNEEMFRIVSVSLGTPPETFTWEYYDKDKKYHKIGPIKPVDFYKKHIKPLYNMEEKVVLVHDPRAQNPYNKLYTVEYLGNMSGTAPVLYINQPIDVLKNLTAKSIADNEAVWFGSDVGKFSSWKKLGMLDLAVYDHELVFGTSIDKLDKAQRLVYGDSLMTHAMVITAFTKEGEKYTKWRVENSWGDDGGEKGYLMMTDDWFTEYTYETVVDKKYIPADILDILKQEPKVLPAWDPMGSLA